MTGFSILSVPLKTFQGTDITIAADIGLSGLES
jgi:hypothetical protein